VKIRERHLLVDFLEKILPHEKFSKFYACVIYEDVAKIIPIP